MSTTPLRFVGVTLGLVVAGGALGALAAALAATLGASLFIAMLGERLDLDTTLFIGGLAAHFGARFGIVVGPLTAWLLLRAVPLGRALLGTTLGAVLGGLLGWLAPLATSATDGALLTIAAPVLGTVGAAWWLRRSVQRSEHAAASARPVIRLRRRERMP